MPTTRASHRKPSPHPLTYSILSKTSRTARSAAPRVTRYRSTLRAHFFTTTLTIPAASAAAASRVRACAPDRAARTSRSKNTSLLSLITCPQRLAEFSSVTNLATDPALAITLIRVRTR